MTDDELALARRVVKAPGWRWIEGMQISGKAHDEERVGLVDEAGIPWTYGTYGSVGKPDDIPNLGDESTRLALAGVARTAWGNPTIYAEHRGSGRWMVMQWSGHADLRIFGHGPTEAAAWVDAICAAPARS